MENIKLYAKENHVPIVRTKTLELLIDTIKKNNSKKILEIGTAIGYSGAQMLLNSNATLTTIEKNDNMYEVAKGNFKRLNLSDRVIQIKGDAKEILEMLVKEDNLYDFIFLDGPKGQYLTYLPLLNQLLSVNGIIFADDVLFRGLVQGNDWPKHRIRTLVLNLRKYLQEVQNPPFTSEIIDMEDGVCITTKGEK